MQHQLKEPETVGDILDALPAVPQPRSPPMVATIDRVPAPVTPMAMLQIAIEKGGSLEMLERLMSLQERWEAAEANKAFVKALSDFKADPPTITKNKHVGFATRDGDKTEYDHATLDQVCRAIAPALSKHGLSHRWSIDQDSGMIRVTCSLTHALGHTERVTLSAGADTSGKKNPIQAVASTVTYLQRYTLLSITGLATEGMDNDGAGADEDEDTISAQQKGELVKLLQETGASTAKFLAYLKIPYIDELPASRFDEAKRILEQRRPSNG